MSTATPSAYDRITTHICTLLEQGTVPWRQPWTGGGSARNYGTQRAYTGINSLILGSSGYADMEFLTYKQAADLGGQVRKGSKGLPIIFWSQYTKEDTGAQDGEVKSYDKPRGFLKLYTVFNIAQIDGLPERAAPATTDTRPDCDAANALVASWIDAPKITTDGGRAYYQPLQDTITMPAADRFHTRDGYYSTLFHELAHSTGHASRLNRPGVTDTVHFGSATYSKEELIAEMCAAFLCRDTGIDNTLDQSAAYISGWLSALKNDKTLLVQAASQAQKAAEYIHGKRG